MSNFFCDIHGCQLEERRIVFTNGNIGIEMVCTICEEEHRTQTFGGQEYEI